MDLQGNKIVFSDAEQALIGVGAIDIKESDDCIVKVWSAAVSAMTFGNALARASSASERNWSEYSLEQAALLSNLGMELFELTRDLPHTGNAADL